MVDDDRPPSAPKVPRIETLLVDQHDHQIAFIDGALWPPIGGVIELGPDLNPRDGVVQWVRLRLYDTKAQISSACSTPRISSSVGRHRSDWAQPGNLVPEWALIRPNPTESPNSETARNTSETAVPAGYGP
jgi:hypothetical protein